MWGLGRFFEFVIYFRYGFNWIVLGRGFLGLFVIFVMVYSRMGRS